MSSEQRVDLAKVSDKLQCLLAEEGFTDEPVGGCPAKPAAEKSRTADVGRIVETVVAELQRRGLT